MANEGSDMNIDSGVSDMTVTETVSSVATDMTVTESVSSIVTDSTFIGSPSSTVVMDEQKSTGDSESTGAMYQNTLLNAASHSIDTGIRSRSGSNNVEPLPTKQKDSQTRTHEWVEKHFDVFVKTLDGKTVTIQVEQDEEVTIFKKKVQEKTNVESSQQYLLTQNGRQLQDGERLSHYDIKKHCTIYCQGRLRGGKNLRD